jgi:hypothetical protein
VGEDDDEPFYHPLFRYNWAFRANHFNGLILLLRTVWDDGCKICSLIVPIGDATAQSQGRVSSRAIEPATSRHYMVFLFV